MVKKMNSAGEKVAIAHFYRVHTYGHFRKRYSKAVANLCKQTGLIRSCNDDRHKLYTLFFCDIRTHVLRTLSFQNMAVPFFHGPSLIRLSALF